MKKIILLFLLLAGILFPVAAIARGSGRFGTLFNKLYTSEIAHIVTHIILFAALVWVVFGLFANMSVTKAVLLSLVIVLLVGIAQEAIQMYSIDRLDLAASFFDLCVDLAGGSIMLLFVLIIKKRSNESLT